MLRQLVVALLCLCAGATYAFDPFVVRDIRVEGIQRIEAGTVFSYLPVKVGETMTDEKAAAAIKALFATGFFKDVRLEVQRDVLIVMVEERPAVSQIDFIGNKEFDKDALRKGLREASWPGRFEILSRRPLVVLDGAHNPNGAAALKEALSSLKKKRLILVIGIMSDKDIDGIMKELVPASDLVIATRPKGERSAALPALMQAASRYGKPVAGVEAVKDACKKALSIASPADCILVAGSLFTVGEAREYLLRALAKR